MKRIPALLLALVAFAACAQQLDYRTTLRVASRAQAFSLAPDGRLWMATRMGEVFYADSVGGLWHEVKLQRRTTRLEDYTIDHVFTPDSHTVVLAGYIYAPDNRSCTGNYIISSDAGHSWEFRSLDTCSEWIDESWRAPDGRIWMGGLSGRLLYSDDHGQTFRTIHRTDTAGDRIGAIWLDTAARRGILAVFGNKLYLTDDGFRAVRRIETPKAQGALVLDRQYWYGRIRSAFGWRQWLFIDQEGRHFYAHRDSLQWHPCPLQFGSWMLSPDGETLVVMSPEGLMQMQSPTEWTRLSDVYGSIIAIDGQRVLLTNHSALIVVEADGTTATYPYLTTDYPIEEPPAYCQARFDGKRWGYSGSDIYMKKGRRWGRVVNTGFDICGLHPTDTCLLVESSDEVYSITRRRTTLAPMRYTHPIDKFLASKPVSVTIVSSSWGCFHAYADTVVYRREPVLQHALVEGGDRFRLAALSLHDTVMPLPVRFFSAAELENLLRDFDDQPNAPVRKADLGVAAADLQALLADTAVYVEWNYTTTTSRVLRQVAEGYDTLSDATVAEAITTGEGFWSTTTNRVTITIVNAAGDTLWFDRRFFESAPFMLPCRVALRDRIFYAAHLPLMRFLGEQMPLEMRFSSQFTPLAALRRIANRLDTNR